MKKLCILLLATTALLTTVNKASAQDKGWWLGGQIGFWHDSDGYYKANSFSISPEVGYDFNKRWSIGLAIGFDYVDEKYFGSLHVFTFSPYARWKFLNKGILSLFLDGGFALATGEVEGFQVGFSPGLALKINDHFSFVTHIGFLGYSNDYFNGGIEGGGDGFGFKLTSTDLKFGFYYKF